MSYECISHFAFCYLNLVPFDLCLVLGPLFSNIGGVAQSLHGVLLQIVVGRTGSEMLTNEAGEVTR